MGFFEKVKEFATKAKCATGFHAGKFVHVADAPQCHVEKTCPDCYEHLTEKRHSYGDPEYLESWKCEKTRVCNHCAEKSVKVVHERYEVIEIDDYCNVKERCVRCRDTKLGKKEHQWYESGRTDHGIEETCSRCRETKSRAKTSFK
jgi:hypothetical protein